MTGLCGVTGCANVVSTKCHWCSLPLCTNHSVTFKTEEGEVVCCRGCAAYLRAKSLAGGKGTTGGDHGGGSAEHDAQR